MSDERAIELGGTNDEFLGEIIDKYRDLMFRAARAITNNDYDADDVIQRLCIRFVTNGIPAGLRENPPAYLVKCSANEAKNVHRKHEREQIDHSVDLMGLSTAPEHGSAQEELLEALKEAKTCLTPEEREVVELYYTDGLAQADIAELKQMQEDTVAQKLSRSRKKMKKVMEVEGRTRL